MNRNAFRRPWLVLLLLLTVALVAAQCGGAAPTAEPTPTAEPAPTDTPVPQEAQPAEEESAAEDSQEVVAEIVEESQAAQATELEGGVTVFTDEPDVSAPRTKLGGEYRDVSTSDAVSFHPYLTTDSASGGYQGMVYAGALLRLDENTLEYIPNMAESYTISEDGLTFTFHLRQDMKWSDGQPITAHDYKWTYDQVTNPDNEFPYLSQLSFITSYEALDDYTLEIKIDEIYAPALGQMSGLITPLPKHVWENLDWSDPELNPEINSPSVVSGPYKLVEWKRDEFAIFEANENYWYHGAPNIERQILEIVPDQDIAYQKMKSGESDTGPITPENLEEARQLDNITVYEWWPAAARWSYIGLNMREGFPTHDINVRHGLSYAIDKQLLTDEVMLGQGKRLCSVYPETSWVYNPNVPCYEYDPDQAIAEFAEAGYTFQDGKMLDENGEQLKLKLIYGPNTSQTRELIAVTVQDYLSDIGIEVEVQALEWASFLEATDAAEPDWDMFIGGWRATIEPHIMYTIWAEESIPRLNSVAYINKEVEAIFAEAGATYDNEFRKQKYQEAQQIISEEAPYIFLFYNKTWSGQNNRIKGIDPRPLGIGWNFEDWFIEETATD
ncbi:MAG: ABC transporter substrate-binding protein [Anaerolineae bacterium]